MHLYHTNQFDDRAYRKINNLRLIELRSLMPCATNDCSDAKASVEESP